MRKRIFVFVFSVGVMLLMLSLFGIEDIVSVLARANLSLILLAALSQLAVMLLYGARFRLMASKYRRLSLVDAFFIATAGNFVSLVTPIAKIGGQPLMIYLTKERIGAAKASAVVLMDTIVDMLSSVLLVGLVVILLHAFIPYPLLLPLAVFAALTLLLIAAFMKLFLSSRILSRLLGWLMSRVRRLKKADKIFHARLFERSFRLVLEDKRLMSGGMLLSYAIKLLEFLRIWIVFSAIGVFLSPAVVVVVWAVMLLLLAIPWLPGSLGLLEFGSAAAFILLGLTSSQAAAGVLLDRFVSFWFVIVVSAAVIFLSRHRLGEIMRIAERK